MSNIEFTKKDLENVATLSRLSLTEEEKEKFLGEMKEIELYVPQPPDFPITREEPSHLKTLWCAVS